MLREQFLDQVAIVTGASSGIGRATSLALAKRGARLVLAARREAQLAQLADEIRGLGRQALILPTDVSHQGQVESMVASALAEMGRVDILVCSAGEYVRAPLDRLSAAKIEHSLAVNFFGSVYPILAVLPHMRARHHGHIIVVTSMDGKKGLPPDAPYVSAKFALTGFLEVLRQELYGSGVYVSNILPGRVDTEMINHLRVPRISAKIAPEVVAEEIIRAILKRKPEVIVPFQAALLHYVNVFSPGLGDWLVRSLHLSGWEDNNPNSPS